MFQKACFLSIDVESCLMRDHLSAYYFDSLQCWLWDC